MKKNKLYFPYEMYTNIFGSVIISALINHIYNSATEHKPLEVDKAKIRNTWFKLLEDENYRKKIDWDFSDEDFFKKTLDFFNIPVPNPLNIAVCITKENVLFAPFIGGEVIPLREDGIMARTLLKGKVYPLKLK